jgi:hypothetical protein
MYKFSDGEWYQVLSIDFVNDEFCILPEEELEGGSQITIKDISQINWDYFETDSIFSLDDVEETIPPEDRSIFLFEYVQALGWLLLREVDPESAEDWLRLYREDYPFCIFTISAKIPLFPPELGNKNNG